MDLWATKTHAEREDEEAERLVRPAPKVKPPRHDRRRERTETDGDPDISSDPDLKGDKDLSKNYKNIGGSLAGRVAGRFLADTWAEAIRVLVAKGQKVKVRHRETGKVVQVSEETLKEEGGKYEKIENEPEDEESSKRGDALRALAKDDEKLQNAFKTLLNPKSDIGGLAKENPALPASAIFKGLKLPEGVNTVGDMVKALQSKPAPKAPKVPKEAPKAEAPPKQPETPAPAPEAPKAAPPASDKPKADAPEAPKTDEKKPEAAPAEDKKPEAPAAEDTPAEKPKKEKGKKPKKPKEKDPDAEEEPEGEVEEPSEAEKAGIKPPARREASEEERIEAATLIMDTFPSHVATDLLAKNLHPDDVGELVSAYSASKLMKVKDPAAFAEEVGSFYETDMNRVKPPKKAKNAAGDTVPFEKLTPEEQSEAMRKHQVQVTALSLGARDALSRELSMPSWTGTPKIPASLTAPMAVFMLRKGKADTSTSDSMFSAGLDADPRQTAAIDDKAVKQLMSRLPEDAKKLAGSYFQAADYHQAKKKFLGDDEDQVSERSDPADIYRTIRRAKGFFESRADLYGEDAHRGQTVFQVRMLDRLRSLDPKKYGEVRQLIGKDQYADYERKKAKRDKEFAAWEKRKQAWDAKQPAYRGEPFGEKPPADVPMPPLAHLGANPRKSRKDTQALIGEVLGRSKMARSVAHRFIFTYPGPHAMGHGSDRTGVYHGVDPLKQYPAAYPDWQPAHQRDLGESDYTAILGSAKEWLKSSVLSVAVEGITRDQQLRAALDLAIRDSKYDGQVQPNLYNNLLARLAGVKEPGLGQTLLTIREAANSSFAPPLKKGTTMKPSQELRKLAATAAESDPKVAFDMIDLAGRLEQAEKAAASTPKTAAVTTPAVDERYTKIRSLVIRTAAVDGAAKKVLLPVLQEIKNLG